jgi:hypothetical protein
MQQNQHLSDAFAIGVLPPVSFDCGARYFSKC